MLRTLCAVVLLVAGTATTLQAQVRACPLRFDRHTVGLQRTCLFLGRYNPTCGENAIAVFAGDGTILVLGIAITPERPIVYLPAAVESPRRGVVVSWLDTEVAASERTALGTVTLEDGGRTLRVRGRSGLFRVDDCPFEEYVGRFVEMVDAGPDAGRFAAQPTPGPAFTPSRN